MNTVPRRILNKVLLALKNHPIVFLNGPRQAGKSTLVQALIQSDFPAEYVTFDNATQMAAASHSPESFLGLRKGPLVIDEVQLVPDVFRALKLTVDELRLKNPKESKGRFLLTGSANIMALPKLSDALVGRVNIKTLYPFASCEILNTPSTFLEQLFALEFNTPPQHFSLDDVITKTTFPEISQENLSYRTEWFENYISTLLQRDVRFLAEIEKIAFLPTLLRTLAARAGKLMNDAEISRDVGLNAITNKAYRSILQAMFLCFDVEPWYRNIGKRLVKSPKGFLTDTLLLCHLLDLNFETTRKNKPELYGHLLENYVATELSKLLSFGNIRAKLMHFRTSDNKEVDFVLERPDASLSAIEVKASSRVNIHDFKGIQTLQEAAGNDFISGIVLYTGTEIVPFAQNLFAIPISSLWY
ncbi:MAG: ATP-binding protein [Gammaproteobacteria bacterium]